MPAKIPITPGTVFGKWTVLGPERLSNSRQWQHLCRCECGTESYVTGNPLRKGLTTQCRNCSNVQKAKAMCHYPDTEGILGHYLYKITHGATFKNRDYSVNITMGDLVSQWKRQNGCCALTGVPLTLKRAQTDYQATASLDRIDNARGYEPDNVQWVHKDINKMKLNHEESYFFELCKNVYLHKNQTKKLREGSRPWMK